MEKKVIVFSAVRDHVVIKHVIKKLKQNKSFELKLHDPTKDYYCLSNIPQFVKSADGIILKVRNECSIDLLHYAKLYNIPTLHSVDSVLLCKNKIALDYMFRKIFDSYQEELKKFKLPNSWNQNLSDVMKFKKWAENKLPIVIKSHYQHDKYNRFNFLVQNINEVDNFCERYKKFLFYDVYIQKFIECDGIERKVYVIGDKVFGIKRENPIYKFLRERPENIDVESIERESFEISNEIQKLSKILSEGLKLKIFGFDLVKQIEQDIYYLIDLNDFPSFKGIPNVENELADYLKNYILTL
jgi:glutathione synthase/RimK-type ligase-like ATP-grasp enzyme